MPQGGKGVDNMTHDLYADIASVMLSAEEIQKRVAELAEEISADYADVDNFIMIGILKGAVTFMADLSRAIKRPHMLDYMAVSSYGAGTKSSGVVQIRMDLQESITGRHILIVEDIIDSGRTLNYLRELLLVRDPASLKICTLLDKPSRREIEVPVDYTGFDIPDEFVIGYGLDFDELYRNIPYIAVLKPEAFGGA